MTDQEEFMRIANLMIKFLAENHHPHVKVIIDSDTAVMLEGLIGFQNDEFIKG